MEIRNPLGGIGSGIAGQIAIYTGAHVTAGDALLTDNGTILTYTGIGGITTPFFNATSPTNAFQINAAPVLALPFGDTSSIAVGIGALPAQSLSGLSNVAVGFNALFNNTTGSANVAVGNQALLSNTIGTSNLALGASALASNTTGIQSVAIGTNALVGNTTGIQNIGIGAYSLFSNTIGIQNVALGSFSLYSNTTGSSNFGLGQTALFNNTTGSSNVALGTSSLGGNTTGSVNVAIGSSALSGNTTGASNVALGGNALVSNTTGQQNVAIGAYSLYLNQTSNNNISVGTFALFNATGAGNVAIGNATGGAITSGSENVFIGDSANAAGAADTNEIVIGANTTGAGSNTAVIGNSSVTDVYFGSSSPSANVRAAGYYAGATAGVSAGPFTAVTSITTIGGIVTSLSGTSDERLKDWVPYTGGLAEILAITPASYHWNEKGAAQTGLPREQEYVGFIAQDVQKAIPQAITATEKSKDGTEIYLSLDDRPIIAALINAVKTLTARIAVLETR